MHWLNEPPVWKADAGRLSVVTGLKTDFWRVTHYGFVRGSGHFYYQAQAGDFTAEVRIEGKYQSLYDQAGLMIRLDEANWIKAGIEYTHGQAHFSAVVTREFSDWSVVPAECASPVWLRLTRRGDAVTVEYSADGDAWRMLRLAYFPEAREVQIGVMCCSPEREGFEVEFHDFRVFS